MSWAGDTKSIYSTHTMHRATRSIYLTTHTMHREQELSQCVLARGWRN